MTKEQEDIFSYCKWYLNNLVSAYTFNHDIKKELSYSLDAFNDCINRCINEEKLEKNFLDMIRSRISTSMGVLKNVFFQTKIDDHLKKFLKYYSNICLNINNNLFNNDEIKSNCDFLHRACDNFITLNESITLFAESSRTLSQWRNYLPPSFRLSDHYYSLIREE